jgi:glycosyltransferase involved in cell wall biosynthesis
MKKKKIILVYDFLKELGGLERMMFFYANCLSKKYEVELDFGYVSDKDKEIITKELELNKNIKIKQVGNSKNEVKQLASFLLNSKGIDNDGDLTISFSFMSNKNAYFDKKLRKTPYISVVCHPPNFLYPVSKGWINNLPRLFARLLGSLFGSSLRKKDRVYIRNADKVIAISGYTSERVKQLYQVNPKIIFPALSDSFRIMNEKEKTKFKKLKNIKKDFILAHGRIIPDKNYKSIVALIKNLNCNLIISGSIEKNYRKELELEILRHNLANRVRILGRISKEDLLGYYNCAKVFVNPAHKEDFGLTPIEAMACGCPAVAWDDGAGPSETIIDGKTGSLAKPYDIGNFEKSIKLALQKKWNAKVIRKHTEKFSKKTIEKQILKEIGSLLK